MKWRILYSARAKEDLQSIYEYIAYDLHEPEIDLGQVRAIMDEIRDLDEMPMRYRKYEAEPWLSKGIRIFSVGKIYNSISAGGEQPRSKHCSHHVWRQRYFQAII